MRKSAYVDTKTSIMPQSKGRNTNLLTVSYKMTFNLENVNFMQVEGAAAQAMKNLLVC